MDSRWKLFGLAGLAAAALAGPAAAHHSGAMFDGDKTLALTGVVKDFRWANPHATIEMLVSTPAGAQEDWSFECSTPNILVRKGWSLHTLKPGDKISLEARPERDGGKAGLLLNVTTASGVNLKDHDY